MILRVLVPLSLAAVATAAWIGYRGFFPARVSVAAAAETAPVPHDDDAADDPAVWVDDDAPERSVVLGTDKRGGLGVYDLDGRELQFLGGERFNNVDLRDGFPLGGVPTALVAVTEGRREQIVFLRLDRETRALSEVPWARINLSLDPEGLTMYRSPKDGRTYVFVVGEEFESGDKGWLEQWELRPGAVVPLESTLVRRFRVGEESEGMVADDRLGHLYVSEEETGIWRYAAEPDGGEERVLVDRVGFRHRLKYNVEGLAIHEDAAGRRHLLASSQGSNDFVVYRLDVEPVPVYVGRFAVAATDAIDGVTHTDGIEAVGRSLGARFPGGLFVCQDDRQPGGHQNFKLVRWADVSTGLGLPGR